MSVFNTFPDLTQALLDRHGDILNPGSGGTLNLVNKHLGRATLSAGTYALPTPPAAGFAFFVVATGAVTLTGAGSLSSGQGGIVIADSDSTWSICGISDVETAPTTGFIDLPLTTWREVTSNDISDAGVGAADSSGGVLATDTTPTLEYVNGDTDSQIRILWAASNVDAIARQITLPPDLDRTANITLHVRAVMSGGDDTPVIDIDSFFDSGDTKVEDATASTLGPSVSTTTATIAAADIPDDAVTLSIELTPGTHTNDTLAIHAIWITYTRT